MYDRKLAVSTMTSWIGIKEGTAAHKYIIDLYNLNTTGYRMTVKDAWCATTVSAALFAAGCKDICPWECSCTRMINKAIKMGIWVEDDKFKPQPGDFLIYDWEDNGVGDCVGAPNHVGMVIDVDNIKMTICEGNKNNAVGTRTIYLNGKYIRGFVTPKYDDVVEKKPEPVVAKISAPVKGAAGIDTSRWQASKVDYSAALKAGYQFAILRIGSAGTKDATFDKDFAAAKAAGIPVGVYYAAKTSSAATPTEAIGYAKQVIQWLNGATLQLPVAFDIEGSPYNVSSRKKANVEMYEAFAKEIKNAGYGCMLYTGKSLYNYAFDKTLMTDPLWIAQYSSIQPEVGRQVAIWQYTSNALATDFYKDKLDRSMLLVDYDSLMKDAKSKNVVPPTPTTNVATSTSKTAAAKSFDKSKAGTYVLTTDIHFRTGPSVSYASQGVLPRNTKVTCYGYYTVEGSRTWLYVSVNGKTGHLAGEYLKKV